MELIAMVLLAFPLGYRNADQCSAHKGGGEGPR
jgi:hypothetical protein